MGLRNIVALDSTQKQAPDEAWEHVLLGIAALNEASIAEIPSQIVLPEMVNLNKVCRGKMHDLFC
jgi:hypothetical protein